MLLARLDPAEKVLLLFDAGVRRLPVEVVSAVGLALEDRRPLPVVTL